MPRFRKSFLSLLPLLAALALLPHTCYAFPTPTYDLESLCLVSTDVVEATLTRHHAAGQPEWEDTFTATVTKPLEGIYKVGDQIAGLSLLVDYSPAQTGQQCILFITRKELRFDLKPSLPAAPRAVDMLLIDTWGHVRRYYQWSNPGGQRAEGGTAESHPTLEAERVVIGAEWAKMEKLRPLLARPPRPEDAPVLQALICERRQPSASGQRDIVREIAQERLASLHVKAD